MICKPVTPAQLEIWKDLYNRHKGELRVNRIDGTELNTYFLEKYRPTPVKRRRFYKAVLFNALENGAQDPHIEIYRIDRNVYVGIDVRSGFFHVESRNISKVIPVWDDLFLRRGLDAQDMENYVIAAQYLQLLGCV